MKHSSKLLLVGAGAATAAMTALTAGAYALSNGLLHIALDRQLPKGIEKQRSRLTGESAGFAQLLAQLDMSAEALRACGCATVQLTARDGTALVGHWYGHPSPKRILVAMHGWRSSWEQDFGLIAPFLHSSGCSVLYAEQRGQNASGGDHITFGLLERLDCADWVDWVLSYAPTALPVYLAGISMGATTVLMAAGLALPAQVKGIIADCGFTSPHAIWQHVAENNLHLNYGLHQPWVDKLFKRKLQLSPRETSTTEALARSRVPVLLIHGSEDAFVPVEMTYENYKACRPPRELLIVPGAGHGMSYLKEQDRYEAALLRFWKQNDG